MASQKPRFDGAVYEIRGNNPTGWYWFLSRPGRAGVQSDTFTTAEECERDVLSEFPGATRVQVAFW